MKQYTTAEQTKRLITLGFPSAKYIANSEWEELPSGLIHLYSRYDYTIGELCSFINNSDLVIWHDNNANMWYVDYNLRRVGLGEELIDALYWACVELKKENLI